MINRRSRHLRTSRVAYFTQWFTPEPVLIPRWIADAMKERGLDLRVHTGIPNFPDGQVHPGFRARRFSRDRAGGHNVLRSPLYPSHDQSSLRRILNYSSWAFSASLGALATCRGFGASVVYSSPATAALPAMVAKVAHKVPYVLIVQDLWPDSVTSTGLVASGWKLRLVEAVLERFTQLAYRMSAHVAVISPSMRGVLEQRGVPSSKISLIYNWVDETALRPCSPDPDFRPSLGLTSEFLVIYGGNLGAAQSLDVAIAAIAMLPPDVHLALVGDGIEKPKLQELAAQRCPGRVHFVQPVPPTQFAGIMAAGDVQLICLRDDPLFAITMPSKVQAVLAAGQPVVISARGDAARLVDDSGAGWSSHPGDIEALSRNISAAREEGAEALRQRGAAARTYYHAHLSQEINAGALVALVNQTMTEGLRSRG